MTTIQFEGIFENYDEVGLGFVGVISGLTYEIVSLALEAAKIFLKWSSAFDETWSLTVAYISCQCFFLNSGFLYRSSSLKEYWKAVLPKYYHLWIGFF